MRTSVQPSWQQHNRKEDPPSDSPKVGDLLNSSVKGATPSAPFTRCEPAEMVGGVRVVYPWHWGHSHWGRKGSETEP